MKVIAIHQLFLALWLWIHGRHALPALLQLGGYRWLVLPNVLSLEGHLSLWERSYICQKKTLQIHLFSDMMTSSVWDSDSSISLEFWVSAMGRGLWQPLIDMLPEQNKTLLIATNPLRYLEGFFVCLFCFLNRPWTVWKGKMKEELPRSVGAQYATEILVGDYRYRGKET